MRKLRALAVLAAMAIPVAAWGNIAPGPRPLPPKPPTQPSSNPSAGAASSTMGFVGVGAAIVALGGGLMLVRRGRGR